MRRLPRLLQQVDINVLIELSDDTNAGIEPESEPEPPPPSPSPGPFLPTQIHSQALRRPAEIIQTQVQLSNQPNPDPFSDLEDPIEYGIQITIRYDKQILFSNTQWFQQLNRHVYNKLVRIETDEVDKASTAKGRTKHQDGPWRVGTGTNKKLTGHQQLQILAIG